MACAVYNRRLKGKEIKVWMEQEINKANMVKNVSCFRYCELLKIDSFSHLVPDSIFVAPLRISISQCHREGEMKFSECKSLMKSTREQSRES